MPKIIFIFVTIVAKNMSIRHICWTLILHSKFIVENMTNAINYSSRLSQNFKENLWLGFSIFLMQKNTQILEHFISLFSDFVVDYLSLDIEGAELDILNTIPWEYVDIR